jgi:hypothetical protein
MKKLIFKLIAAAFAASALAGCDFLIGPEEPAGKGGNLIISFGEKIDEPAGRAVTSGKDLPKDVLDALVYKVTLTGPGEVPEQTVYHGQTLQLTVALGAWQIDVKAYKDDGLAGKGSRPVTIAPGVNSFDIPLTINKGYFDIALGSMANGTVERKFEAAFPEATITLTVKPEEGYRLKEGSLKVNDGAVPVAGSGPYTFAMPAANVTIRAEFELPPPDAYSISVTPPDHGTVSSNTNSAQEGDTITLTMEPEEGYRLKEGSLKVNDGAVPIAGSGPYTFAMPAANVTVSAEFEGIPYTVSVATLSNGTVTCSSTTAIIGDIITLTVTPDTGYRLKEGSLKVNDGAVPVAGSGPYTFAMPASNVTVSAFFNKTVGAFIIQGPQDETITVTTEYNPGRNASLGERELSWSNSDRITFTVEGYTVGTDLKWFMEGKAYNGTGNSIIIEARDYVPRSYGLTVMVKVNDLWYSAETSITIVP